MRKAQKQEVLECINSLHQAHREVKEALLLHNYDVAQNMLSECQEFAVFLGETIEGIEGERHISVLHVEEYCETLFWAFQEIINGQINVNKIYKTLKRQILRVENSVKNDILVKKEIVFFPYKASMWDSLESVYLAAKADSECDTYCVPIPYYDMNPDRSFGRMHYEGEEYPEGIEIIDWEKYNFEDRKPDVIYIHNPYDGYNLVTSVHPRYYSSNLKKYTDTLVYIPYYTTSGGMSGAQSLLPSYFQVDYIVLQSPSFKKYFDKNIPGEKFLPFGSPKFDRVIEKCQNISLPPAEWAEKMIGKNGRRKKVIFYNTSLNGLLRDTENFLKKMEYVFKCFMGREDVCLLWRPHPLFESTIDSMRSEFRPVYDELKRIFVEHNLGIYDTTPDIEDTIALCEAYIGDAGTSVISLFGVVGKPIFILNNYIHDSPEIDDWRGEKIALSFDLWGNDRYQVTANNQLWFSENNDYHYKFCMNLECEYSGGGYYLKAVEIGDEVYVIPCNMQHILIIKDKKVRKIEFERQNITGRAFCGCHYNKKYIFLLPDQYSKVIRFDVESEEVRYIDGIKQFYVGEIDGKFLVSGSCLYGKEIVFGSPRGSEFLFMDVDTLETRHLQNNSKYNLGTLGIVPDPFGSELWILPTKGMVITRWNPRNGEIKEYTDLPDGFKSVSWPDERVCEEQPFGMIAFSRASGKENIVISPNWGNMYLTIDRETGKMAEWKSPVGVTARGKNGYFLAGCTGGFIVSIQQRGNARCKLWHVPDRKLYEINIDTKEYREIEVDFDYEELKAHEPGFADESEWRRYCLNESAFNTLKDFLDDRITGNGFDKQRQIDSYAKINADSTGTCGKKIHDFLKANI